MDVIDSFYGEYTFLSNFYSAPVMYDGITYRNSEAAFQAQKTLDQEERVMFADLYPSNAKLRGRKAKLRPDWERVKDGLMYEIVKAKFTQNEGLKCLLLNTGDAELIEGNSWGDTYWGMCNGIGKNKLGLILMRIREELLEESSKYSKDNFKRGGGIYE